MRVPFKLKNDDHNLMPYRKNDNDAGYDLKANIEEPVTLYRDGPFEEISTGVIVSFPDNLYAEIFPRSGTGGKGVNLMNQTGIIDTPYRGEIKVRVYLNSKSPEETYTIEPYERIVQMVFKERIETELSLVPWDYEFTETSRMDDGFGASGRF
jgi:dUTP pyrophosphatase